MSMLLLGKPLTERAFTEMKKNAEKMRFDRTGLIPKSNEEYSNLKVWYKELGAEEKKNKLQQNKADLMVAQSQSRGLAVLFGGKVIGDGNTGILGLPTIWAHTWSATDEHPKAPWPQPPEYREEGDERYTSNYGRFLPIPRIPGNPTVAFKHRSWNPVEALDKVLPVPKLYAAVNLNDRGLFDTTVDEHGVPYDDKTLKGNEVVIEKGKISIKVQVGVSSYEGKDEQAGVIKPPLRDSRLRAAAPPFVPGVKKVEDFVKTKTSSGDSMSYMKDVFMKANTGRLVEGENLVPQATVDTDAILHAFIAARKAKKALEESPLAGYPKNFSRPGGLRSVEKQQQLPSPPTHKAGFQPEPPLSSVLDKWFHALNAKKANKVVTSKDESINSGILQTNTNRNSSEESSASHSIKLSFDEYAALFASLNGLGLQTSSGSSSMYSSKMSASRL